MANVSKYMASQTGRMCAHYERTPDCFGNEYIDRERTHLNYNLAEKDQPLKQTDFIKKRKNEVKHRNRKDLRVMCDWVVTLPKEIKPTDTRKFFEETYTFLNERYGRENVISAYVHMDETTPHMHYAFVPTIYDRELKDYKISAKDLFTLGELRSFHSDLENYLETSLGYNCGVSTNHKNINLNLRKYKELMKEIDKIRDKALAVNEEELEINPFTRTYKKESVDKLIESNKYVKQQNVYLQEQNASLNNTLLYARNELKRNKDKLKRYKYEDFEKKYKEEIQNKFEALKENENLKRENVALKDQNEKLVLENNRLERLNSEIKERLREYEEKEIREMEIREDEYNQSQLENAEEQKESM